MDRTIKHVDALVIGAGVIGTCVAYYLLRSGREVTIIDRNDVASGSSYGNSGLIVPSHSIPLAAPGVISKGLRWLLNPTSPFYVKPRLSRDLAYWMWRFQAAARPAPMHRSIPVLAALTLASASLYKELIPTEGIECDYSTKGLLGLYTTDEGFSEGKLEADLMRQHGIQSSCLSPQKVVEIEPTVRPDIRGAILYETDSNLEPVQFVRGIAAKVLEMGGKIEPRREARSVVVSDRKLMEVTTCDSTSRSELDEVVYKAEEIVLATGAWSSEISKQIDLRIPVQPAKGYSITIPVRQFQQRPNIPMMAHEARAALAPMGAKIRMAGTLEISGLNTSINWRRIRAIVSGMDRYVTGLGTVDAESQHVWCGMRPCTPDGLPIIGRPHSVDNLIIATGHATIGMTLGPITGRLVSQIAARQKTELDLTLVTPDRFV